MKNNDILKKWHDDARLKVKEKLNLKNFMEAPKIEKIVFNIGLSEAVSNQKLITKAVDTVSNITGQRAVKALAKKSIAGFKIREGMYVGVFVTLRGKFMYYFLNKLINLVFPKIRDFQGLSRKFDGHGNYNIGLKDISVFSEAENHGVSEFNSGFNITIVTSAKKDLHAMELLENMGMPFNKKIEKKF